MILCLAAGLTASAALAAQDAAPPAPPARPTPVAIPTLAVAPAPPAPIDIELQAPAAVLTPAAPAPPRPMAMAAPAPFAPFGDEPQTPVPPAAPVAPLAPAAPLATPVPPAPPNVIYLEDQDNYRELGRVYAQHAREQQREMEQQIREQTRQVEQQAREQARQAAEDMRLNIHVPIGALGNLNLDLSPQQLRGPAQLMTPPARLFRGNDNTLYGRGQTALDNHKYDEALDYFTEVVARGGPKADGALYWKAYTLNKLGRSAEATAAIAQLRTSFPSSHWLEDAKALELEVKQAAGKPVSPESESDDDLKLMALNGLAQTDPARAFPLLDKLLKGPASPKLKKNAIYVLAINNTPQAQQLLEQIARGNSNPDLQITAIGYMLRNKQFPNRTQTLYEIYNSTNDAQVKREIINALRSNSDTDHLMQIYKAEKDPDLRRSAIGGLGDKPGNAELWQLYQGETATDAKLAILDAMHDNGNTEKLTEVARNDKDPKVRMRAIQVLASYKAVNLGDTLASLYSSEQDPQVKRQILNEISSRRNAKALVDIYHKETNFELKKAILTHLGNMRTAEANELYMEILNK
jgi:hypothetical protein